MGGPQEAAELSELLATRTQEENAIKNTAGGNDGDTRGAFKPKRTGSVTANAVQTNQSDRT